MAAAVAYALARSAGVYRGIGMPAMPTVLRTAAAAIVLFGSCGYAPAVLSTRGRLRGHRALLVLPLGAAVSSIALAVLGVAHVPLKAALAIVIGGGVVAAAYVLRRATPQPSSAAQPAPAAQGRRSLIVRVVLPFCLAAIVALISLLPIFREGFVSIPGQNGDAILVAGSAVLIEHAPPTAIRPDLPITRIPLEWRSKYPIYYALAAISTIAGLDPIRAFATVSALMLALTAFGLFLFACYALRAPPWVALLAMFLVPLDRIVIYVTIHPYYNELWGQFTLPFILLAGWQYLHEPSRRTAILLVLFLLLGLLAYPLMIPFPAVFLLACGWSIYRRRRAQSRPTGWISALELPRLGHRRWLWMALAVVAVPAAVVLGRGFFDKTTAALSVLAPWSNLSGWHGTALQYLPWQRFVGMPGSAWVDVAGLVVVALLGGAGLRHIRPELRMPMAAMVLATALVGVYFRVRGQGELFYFKDLAFLGPYVLILALVELAALAASSLRHRALLGVAGLALALWVIPAGAAREIDSTYEQANLSVLGLRSWDRALPPGSSVRIDIPPSGYQLWAAYMLVHHPLSTEVPLGGFFPHPPYSRKADYVIAERTQLRPADAIGAPLMANVQFELWRMNPAVPGPDLSSRGQIIDALVPPYLRR